MRKGALPRQIGKTFLGCTVFALGFDLFLVPNGLNAGGISGIAMVLVKLLGFGSVGLFTAAMNLPLFFLGGRYLGRRFLLGSLLGMFLSATLIDLFSGLPSLTAQPLLAVVYGGCLCGLGIGVVFSAGMTTGGADILLHLMKKRWHNVPIGVLAICFDGFVAVVTGILFRDGERMLYCGIAVFAAGRTVDSVLRRFL